MLRRLSAAVATIREDHRSRRSDLEVLHRRWGRTGFKAIKAPGVEPVANMRSSSKVNKVLAPSEAGPFVLPEKGLVLKGPRRSCIPLTVSFSVTVLPEATPELKKPWTALVKVPVAGVVAN